MNITFTKNWQKANHLTHSGKFHADEVFATVLLGRAKKGIILSRVQDVSADLSPDVFVYDLGHGPYDHHQKGGNGERPSRPDNTLPETVKYAACGLIWRDFGPQIVTRYLEQNPKSMNCSTFYEIPDGTVEALVTRIDQNFIQFIDADDNGQARFNLSDIIGEFNPAWNESTDPDACFMQAVAVAEQIFARILTREIAAAAASTIVNQALDASSNNILVLDRYLTYEPALLESTHEKAKDIHFVVYPSNRNGFNVRTVPLSLDTFENRKDLPAAWAGLTSADLQAVTGVATASFCHNARFLAVADTLEDALALARLAEAS